MLADLIVHVVDASEPEAERAEAIAAVDSVLEEIGAGDAPRLLVVQQARPARRRGAPRPARRRPATRSGSRRETGEGIEELRERSSASFAETLREVDLLVPYAEGGQALRALRARRRPGARRARRRRARPRAGPGRARASVRRVRRASQRRGGPTSSLSSPVELACIRLRRRRPPARRARTRATRGSTCTRRRRRTLGPGERAGVGTGIAVEIPDGPRRAGAAALGARHAPRDRARQRPGPDRLRLPRRAARAAAEHRRARSRSRSRRAIASPSSCSRRTAIAEPVEVDELSGSARGSGGFGSSGA